MAELPTGTVTFLFTDIEGSTRLWEQHPDAMRLALARHDAILRQAIESHRGTVFKTMGDAFCAAFAIAPEAVAAAVQAQRALHTTAWEEIGSLRSRMVLHTGAADLRDGDYFGPPLNCVARLLQVGHGGQILLSLATRELAGDNLPESTSLRDLGVHRLRDLSRPERIYQVVGPDLPGDFPPLMTLDLRPNNLPAQATPPIGRERERERVRDLLGVGQAVSLPGAADRQADSLPHCRLVTLTGPGGTGKTRLALQVAADQIDAFEDGVFFVDLAPLTDPALVATTIAQTLSVRESGAPLLESLKEFLRQKQMLLVLDNFEQVLQAAPVVAELLAATARLSVLVTSRAALHVRGEQEFGVPRLPLPNLKELSDHEADLVSVLDRYAATALFIQRARAVRAEFTVVNEDVPAIVEICHRLDGLPLAIELAAARTRVLAPQALLARLDRRLALLTGGARDLPARQQTLRDTIAWSYDLLNAPEQTLFRRLSVFVGGFTLEAAEAVCNAEGDLDVLDGIDSLVDKSLLRRDEDLGGESRFGMLETIREFGSEKLRGSAEWKEVCARHRDWYLQMAEQSRSDPREYHTWLDRERDNLRAALEWSLTEEGGEEKGLRLVWPLHGYWKRGGYYTEGREWMAKLAAKAGECPSPVRAYALQTSAHLAYEQGDVAAARALREETLAIFREVSHPRGIAHNLYNLGGIALAQGDWAAARAFCEESLALARASGFVWEIAWSLNYLAGVAGAEGDYATARAMGEESLGLFRRVGTKDAIGYSVGALGSVVGAQGDSVAARALCEESLAAFRGIDHKRGTAWSLAHLGDVAGAQGEHTAARRLFMESLTLLRELGHRGGIARLLEGFASLAAAQGQPERAARLLGASEALRDTMDYDWWQPLTRVWYDRDLAGVRAARGEAALAAAWAEGRAITLNQAVAYALQDSTPGEAE